MNEKKTKRRGWIKNCIIIFLALMLALTLFSNTILNASLPQVAVTYPQSGSISSKIRGQGTVVANQNYEVTISETRTIESVLFKVGDRVEKGDIIATLENTDSDELVSETANLKNAQIAYNNKLLEKPGDASELKYALEKAQKELDDAKAALTKYPALAQSRADLKDKIALLEQEIKDTKAQSDTLSNKLNDSEKYQVAYYSPDEIEEQIADADRALARAERRLDNAQEDYDDASAEDIADAKDALDKAQAEYDAAQDKCDTLEKQLNYANLKIEIDAIDENVEQLTERKSEFQEQLDEVEKDLTSTSDELEIVVSEKQLAYDKAKQAYDNSDAQSEINEQNYQIELSLLRDNINQINKRIAELRKNSIGGTIKAPVAGTIANINLVAGEKVNADSVVASLVVSEKGFSITMNVTNEQASKIKVGELANVQYYYYGETPTVKIVSIKTDPSSAGKSKIVTLQVDGDVSEGQNISFTLGEKGATYDTVVPNSALREDNNGKFVLVVVAKSTPLGNRYNAERKAVDVLASDESSSAISGAFAGGEYIITTASSPISDGMQVRMAE